MNEGTKSVNVRDYYNNGYEKGFQKGKLEQKKEELEFLNDLDFRKDSPFGKNATKVEERIKQLSKEIEEDNK